MRIARAQTRGPDIQKLLGKLPGTDTAGCFDLQGIPRLLHHEPDIVQRRAGGGKAGRGLYEVRVTMRTPSRFCSSVR